MSGKYTVEITREYSGESPFMLCYDQYVELDKPKPLLDLSTHPL
jgi:hypothetical protein